MALDNIVRWKDGNRPTRDEARKVIKQFFNEAATEIRWSKKGSRFFVWLVGRWSHPLKGIRPIPKSPGYPWGTNRDRSLEVFLGDDHVDVITRMADGFTNSCARGLAEVFARGWDGMPDRN